MQRAASRWTFVVLAAAALAIVGGLASLAFGIECFATDDPGARCGVLTVAVPLVTLPLGGGLAVVGMGLAGRLVREPTDDEMPSESSTERSPDGQEPTRTA